MTDIIKPERFTKSYGKLRGIIEVDLEINEGEAFGFRGPKGAGKTTTIRTLLDLGLEVTGCAELHSEMQR
jgi:ABC-2 type transport system ATP-binding protein